MANGDQCQYDVFISYARADGADYAARLDEDLRAAGFRTWRDTRSIDVFQDFSAEIEMAIKASRFVATCITPSIEANANSFVRREIIYAQNQDKPIIPLIFPGADVPLLVTHLTWLPFYADGDRARLDYARGWEALSQRLSQRARPDKRRRSDDPYHDYLKTLYDQIVFFLNQTVFALITLRSDGTPDAVPGSPRVLPMTFFRGAGIAAPADAGPSTFENFHAAYDQHEGRVLLLGEPGAGKTTTLFAFARDMVVARQADSTLPLPIIVPISTWDPFRRTPLVDWLAEQVPALPAKGLARLIDGGRALLMLDGLDELGEERIVERQNRLTGELEVKERFDPRERFLDVVQSLHDDRDHTPVVVTSRVKEYDRIGRRIALQGAVTLRPLDDDQMAVYLREMPDLWAALQADDDLREIARTPLLLSLFTFAYRDQGEQAAQLRDLRDSPGELRDAIFRQYIRRRYEHEQRKPHAEVKFTLEELTGALGKLAMSNVSGFIARGNEIPVRKLMQELGGIPRLDEAALALADLAVQLNLLRRDGDVYSFIHLLLRDHFAYEAALKALESARDQWGRRDPARAMKNIGRYPPDLHLKTLVWVTNGQWDAFVDAGSDMVPSLVDFLKAQRGSPSLGVMRVLGEIGDAPAAAAIGDVLKTGPGVHRIHAAKALGRLGAAEGVPALLEVLGFGEWPLRSAAVQALGAIGDASALPDLVGVAWGDPSDEVRRAAVYALSQIGGAETASVLVDALTPESTLNQTLCQETENNVIIVSEEIGPLTLMGIMLERGGIQPHKVMTDRKSRKRLLANVIEMVHEYQPSCVLVDGHALMELVSPLAELCPTLLLTARGDAETHMGALDRGAYSVVPKPILHHDLIAAVPAVARIKNAQNFAAIVAALEKVGTPEALAAVANWRAVQPDEPEADSDPEADS